MFIFIVIRVAGRELGAHVLAVDKVADLTVPRVAGRVLLG